MGCSTSLCWQEICANKDHVSRLFVSDLDGTLVGKSARLSAWSKRHLCRMLGEGLLFTVATARSIETAAPLLDGLPLRLPVIELNGALLTDLHNRSSSLHEVLSAPVARAVVERAHRIGLAPYLTTYAAGRQALYPPLLPGNEGMLWYYNERQGAGDTRLKPRCSTDSVLPQPLLCLTLIARKQPLRVLKQGLEADFGKQINALLYPNPYQTGWYWLTVQSARANKAHALGSLCESLRLQWRDVTVFGDEVNDLAMFEAAGYSVAVDNAVPPLKARADRVIGANDTDSVVRYLMDHFTAP